MALDKKILLDNAENVIECFGGIRPMSSKTGIPVTTIQGWKKRGSIPEGRFEEIQKAAQDHDIDLSRLSETLIHENNAETMASEERAQSGDVLGGNAIIPVKTSSHTDAENVYTGNIGDDQIDALNAYLEKMERRAVTKSVLISVLLIVVTGALGFFLLNTEITGQDQKIETLGGAVDTLGKNVAQVEQDQSFLGSLVPQNWQGEINKLQEQADQLQNQASQLQEQVGTAIKKAEEVSRDVLAQDAGTLDTRISKLEAHMAEFGQSESVTFFWNKIQTLQSSMVGQETLDKASDQLGSALSGFEGAPDQLNGYLDKARQGSDELAKTFENVPQQDLKAAAYLFAFNQVRGALNRDGEPFDGDLQILKNLVGDEDPELLGAIDKISPHAQSGVLTISGLSKELRGAAGDVVVASLKGEDVTFQEKATARLNEILSVEKDGELVTGTETQVKLYGTQKLLENGDLAGAIAEAKSLGGPEVEALAPWLEKAEATLAAHKLQGLLDGNITIDYAKGAINSLKSMGSGLGGGGAIQPYDFSR